MLGEQFDQIAGLLDQAPAQFDTAAIVTLGDGIGDVPAGPIQP